MAYKYYTKTFYSTVCHILEFNPKEYRLDVTLGVRGKLETIPKISGEPKSDERTLAKMNASFFAMNGKGGDTYSTLVDEGLYYHASCAGYPTLVFWKDYTMTFENDPTQERLAYYQKNAFFAIGIGWTLVIDGKVNYTYSKEKLIEMFSHPYQRAPRTMIGQKTDGTIVMVVTNGRLTGSSGLTTVHESDIMLKLGCKIAANMDGGGSSEMYLNGSTVNKLQGGYHRPIGTAFMVYEKINITGASITYTPIKSGTVAKASTVNVRTGPGTSYSKLGTISKGTAITIVGTNSSQNWYKFTSSGYAEGWISASYVNVNGSASTTTTTSTTASTTKKTTTANLNMRSGRGTGYKVLATIPKGTSVAVSDLSNGWYKVVYNNVTGYCSAKYLK